MPDLTIRKVDEQSGKGIPGVTLRVTKEGAKEYQDVTTGLDGVFVLENVTPGWYIIRETDTLEGYILDETPCDPATAWTARPGMWRSRGIS